MLQAYITFANTGVLYIRIAFSITYTFFWYEWICAIEWDRPLKGLQVTRTVCCCGDAPLGNKDTTNAVFWRKKMGFTASRNRIWRTAAYFDKLVEYERRRCCFSTVYPWILRIQLHGLAREHRFSIPNSINTLHNAYNILVERKHYGGFRYQCHTSLGDITFRVCFAGKYTPAYLYMAHLVAECIKI